MKIDVRLLPHQLKALKAKERVVVMSMGVASGKTATVACLAIISLLQGKRVLVIEPTYDQIKNVFMREVEKQLVRYGLMIEGTKIWNLNNRNLKYMSGEILARSAESGKSAFAGLDGIDTFIVDEASEIQDFEIFTEGFNRQRKCKYPAEKKAIIVGTGSNGEHWMKQLGLDPANLLINACYRDNYFLDEVDLLDFDHRYGPETIFPKSYIDQYVYGKFVDSSEESLFHNVRTDAPFIDGPTVAGYDCAYSGKGDDSCYAVFKGNKLLAIHTKKTRGDEEMKAFQAEMHAVYQPDYSFYDSTGNAVTLIGVGLNFASNGGQFANMRTKMYFDLKRKLSQGICLSDQAKFLWPRCNEELLATSLNLEKETRKPILCPKDKVRKLIGRSPDVADALAMATQMAVKEQTTDFSKLYAEQYMENPFRGY